MRFAINDNKRVEAQPKLQGLCPNCSQPVIAKCGDKKVWHWAHLSITSCDSWWEPETEWHRNWKDNYPAEWQEIILFDEQTNEKHIADIRTIHNLVLEFQHSFIKSEERISREKFYRNMLWIVDGSRLKRDYTRFHKAFINFKRTKQQDVYVVDFPDEVFPKNWLKSTVPVIFDFIGLKTIDKDEVENTLWCLLPQKDNIQAVVVGIMKSVFIQISHDKSQLFLQSEKSQPKQILPPQTQLVNRRTQPTHDFYKGKWVKRRRL